MEHLKIPEGYSSPLTIRETEVAIKEVKDHFERALAKSLHLTRVSAPLFVLPQSGMNDNQRAGRCLRGNRSFPRKMEAICLKKIRFSFRRRSLH